MGCPDLRIHRIAGTLSGSPWFTTLTFVPFDFFTRFMYDFMSTFIIPFGLRRTLTLSVIETDHSLSVWILYVSVHCGPRHISLTVKYSFFLVRYVCGTFRTNVEGLRVFLGASLCLVSLGGSKREVLHLWSCIKILEVTTVPETVDTWHWWHGVIPFQVDKRYKLPVSYENNVKVSVETVVLGNSQAPIEETGYLLYTLPLDYKWESIHEVFVKLRLYSTHSTVVTTITRFIKRTW